MVKMVSLSDKKSKQRPLLEIVSEWEKDETLASEIEKVYSKRKEFKLKGVKR